MAVLQHAGLLVGSNAQCMHRPRPRTVLPITQYAPLLTPGARAHVRRRCVRAACSAVPHPDWPRQDAANRYEGLRDEDVLELQSFLHRFQASTQTEAREGPGEVHLVGTGPGDPGLLTLRAVQLMQIADVVLYDRLVSDDILNLVGPQARMVYVGKHSGFHTRSQEEIHALLLAFAEAGATVIRLKGGDPYVFGRGGEEVQYLAARGITVHSVPGITAASGICAELGIPMTHRGVATSVRFLTGHARDGGEQELLDSTVAGAADPHTTLVVYMGLQALPKLYAALAEHGMRADVPAVAVERGTTRRQRVVWGPIGELPNRAHSAGLKSPTLIIIGEVVALAPGWQDWENAGRPLLRPAVLPRHQYALPSIDAAHLQQCAAGAVARLAARGTQEVTSDSESDGMRTRDVPLAAASSAGRDAPGPSRPAGGAGVPPGPFVVFSAVLGHALGSQQHHAVDAAGEGATGEADEGECEGEMCEFDWGEDDEDDGGIGSGGANSTAPPTAAPGSGGAGPSASAGAPRHGCDETGEMCDLF